MAPSHPRRTAVLTTTVVAAIYGALACLAYWPVRPFDATHIVDCACGDAVQQAWFLQWVPFALTHGLDPLFSTYLNAPQGVNLGINTSMPLLGLLGWPVTAASNAVAAFNVLLRLGLALSALSMYLVLRRYVRSRAAAFVGGLLFGFSPYMLAEGRLHVFLVFLPLLPPLIPLLDHWLVRADRDPRRCGALVGLLLGLEMLISVELAAVFVVVVLIAFAPLALRHRDVVRTRLRSLARGLAPAAAAGLVVGGYPVWMFLHGPQRPTGPPHSVYGIDLYHSDLLSPILPSRPQLVRPSFLQLIGDQFVRGNLHENGYYLGVPLLAILVIGTVWLRRNALVLSFATIGLVSFVLGLGTQLTVAGQETSIPLPFVAITALPALQEIGPPRFSLPIQLAAAVLLALVLDEGLRHFTLTAIRRRLAVAALSLVVLLPLLPNGLITSYPLPSSSYFASDAVSEIPAGATVLPYPFASYSGNVAMVWQIQSDLRFRMPGGEVYVPGPTGRSENYPHGDLPDPLWDVLVQGGPDRLTDWTPPPRAQRGGLVSALRTYVATHGIDAMVVSTDGTQGRWVSGLARSAFGAPTSVHDGLVVWIRPAPR